MQRTREYWSRTPLERMQALEQARQKAYGYGLGKPLPKFVHVMRVVDMK